MFNCFGLFLIQYCRCRSACLVVPHFVLRRLSVWLPLDCPASWNINNHNRPKLAGAKSYGIRSHFSFFDENSGESTHEVDINEQSHGVRSSTLRLCSIHAPNITASSNESLVSFIPS